jgi:hypothetical protein
MDIKANEVFKFTKNAYKIMCTEYVRIPFHYC